MQQIKTTILLILMLFLSCWSGAQEADYLEDSDVYTGKADIFHNKEVKLLPGFRAYKGCDVHVYIDSLASYDPIVHTPDPGDLIPATTGPAGYNWVHTTTMRNPVDSPDNINSNARTETYDYYDGLGRFAQKVVVQGSPDNKDIVQAVTYDDYGRKEYEYLPYEASTNTGTYASDAVSQCINIYTSGFDGRVGDAEPVTQTVYEPSPLNRVEKTIMPGANWRAENIEEAKGNTVAYSTNTVAVDHYSVTGQKQVGHFAANQLYVIEFTDEDGNVSREFKDKLGQVVRKEADDIRMVDGEQKTIVHATSYVYDDFGLLRCVVPPKAQGAEGINIPTDINDLCYFYTYDDRKRMIEKDLPGAGVVYMVYDKRDRLVMTQDANMRAEDPEKWLATLYDAFNRPVMTAFVTTQETDPGIIRDGFMADTGDLYESFDTSNPNFGYTFNSFPDGYTLEKADILTVNWYDSYDFTALSDFSEDDYNYSSYNLTGFGTPDVSKLKGLVTGSLERVIKVETANNLEDEELVTVPYYDVLGRVIRSIADNHLGGKDASYTRYNFAGQPEKTVLKHNVNSQQEITMATCYEYDHQGRLLNEKLQMDDSETVTTLATYQYNDIGELLSKYLHDPGSGGNYNQKIDYAYNIRGWLLGMNDYSDMDNDLFALGLKYEAPTGDELTANANYNGNISQMRWHTVQAPLNEGEVEEPDNPQKGYGFKYDMLNRLKEATYAEGTSYVDNKNAYNASYDYDLNGNLEVLNRDEDATQIDQLTYEYINDGNKLQGVADGTFNTKGYSAAANQTYGYDTNGNMTNDPSKGITVEYNYLNLPRLVTGSPTSINYYYTASGVKLRKQTDGNMDDQSLLDYSGPFIYEDGKLKSIFTSEGRIAVFEEETGSGEKDVLYKFEYNLKDHLGNTRMVFGGHTTGRPEWVQRTDYYPFGMVLAQHNYTTFDEVKTDQLPLENKFLYNGKEWQSDNMGSGGLDWYDYGARFYDPQLGRFHSVDPKATDYYFQSPFVYAANNPIIYIDINGEGPGGGMMFKLRQANNIVNGLGNVTFGVVGAVGSAIYIGGTGTLGAALGGTAAFGLSVSEVGLGVSQIIDAVSALSGNGETTVLQESNSLPGLIANGIGSENAELIDAVGQFLPGTLSGGNLKTILETPQTLKESKNAADATFNVLNSTDAVLDTYGVGEKIIESKADNNNAQTTQSQVATFNKADITNAISKAHELLRKHEEESK
ncbi:DUF6443 domain-containing protein [Sunxiuqinia sp. A32]|uniref:DUF6443 domain-containing protein n=1 Tax=Sunxiuqinia sp. A32 TaxID=3461496 RepID=UPI0040464C11